MQRKTAISERVAQIQQSNHRLGKLAYQAYCASTGGKSLVSGAALPAWERLSYEIREAWHAAADAVAADRAALLASRGQL
jgi:hypothetical protein